MSCSRGDLSLSAPASCLAWGRSDKGLQHQRVHTGGLIEGHGGSLLSGGDALLVWLRDFAIIVLPVGGIIGGTPHMLNQNRCN